MDSSISELSRIQALSDEFLELKNRCAQLTKDLEATETLLDISEEEIEELEVMAETAKEDRDLMFWVGIATVSAVLFAPDVANLLRIITAL